MIEHPEGMKRMGLKAEETFEDEFSFDKLAKSYIDFYRSI